MTNPGWRRISVLQRTPWQVSQVEVRLSLSCVLRPRNAPGGRGLFNSHPAHQPHNTTHTHSVTSSLRRASPALFIRDGAFLSTAPPAQPTPAAASSGLAHLLPRPLFSSGSSIVWLCHDSQPNQQQQQQPPCNQDRPSSAALGALGGGEGD